MRRSETGARTLTPVERAENETRKADIARRFPVGFTYMAWDDFPVTVTGYRGTRYRVQLICKDPDGRTRRLDPPVDLSVQPAPEPDPFDGDPPDRGERGE